MQDLAGACAPRVTGVELDSLVSSVKDLLPDLGEGFIEVTTASGAGLGTVAEICHSLEVSVAQWVSYLTRLQV